MPKQTAIPVKLATPMTVEQKTLAEAREENERLEKENAELKKENADLRAEIDQMSDDIDTQITRASNAAKALDRYTRMLEITAQLARETLAAHDRYELGQCGCGHGRG